MQRYPPQQPTPRGYPPQQPPPPPGTYTQYPQQPPPGYQFQPPQGPYAPPSKKSRKGLWIGLAVFLVVVVVSCSLVGMATSGASTDNSGTSAPSQATSTLPESTPTATPKPKPTETPAQIEAAYKASTTSTDVVSMDKDGSASQGNDEHFTCAIANFVKDSSGITGGANVTDPSSSSGSFVQVIFTPGTDITRLNTGDILEVWGANQGASSGTNAFGATIQEVVVQARYMKDQTTGYRADS